MIRSDGMTEDQIDFAIKNIAQAYAQCLSAAKSNLPNDPMMAGSSAQLRLLAAIRQQGGTAIKSEPRTGVDSAGGGQSRFDILFSLNNTDIYLEVQASGYHHGHKPVQLQGQVIGFAEVSAGMGMPARYYKIIGNPRQIYRWSRRAAQNALAKGDYKPQLQMSY